MPTTETKGTGLFRSPRGRNYLMPFVLITTLFFLWGFAHSILDVLNKHFQVTFEMTKTRSALVQAVVYGGYFLMALPAGAIIRRAGYRTGVITGLLLYALGALMFIPGSYIGTFEFFLLSLFIIGCGLTCLETAANPYVTVLGSADGAERRINIAQSFNGLGWIFGPAIGGLFVFGQGSGRMGVAIPYAAIGVVVLIVALIFSRIHLPEPSGETGDTKQEVATERPLFARVHFVFGLVALFLYVAAQTGVNSFFINYAEESADVSPLTAAALIGYVGMGLFMLGRILGSWGMKFIAPDRLLLLCAIGACAAMIPVMVGAGSAGFYSYFACFLFESIMFPTIFALSIRRLGAAQTKTASSILIMAIVGGAVAPLLMGAIADASGTMSMAFIVPMICFIVIAVFAALYRRL